MAARSEEGSRGPSGLLRTAPGLGVSGAFLELCKKENVNKAVASPRSWQRAACAHGASDLPASVHAMEHRNQGSPCLDFDRCQTLCLQITLNPPHRKHTHHPTGSPHPSVWPCRKVSPPAATAQTPFLSFQSTVWCFLDTPLPTHHISIESVIFPPNLALLAIIIALLTAPYPSISCFLIPLSSVIPWSLDPAEHLTRSLQRPQNCDLTAS